MQTPTRAALMGRTRFALIQMLRLMGADAGSNETKESIINRILLFQRQEFKKEEPKDIKPVDPVKPEELTVRLLPLINDGLSISYEGQLWNMAYDGRQDSGNLAMPIEAIERCAKYLMRIAV